MNNTVKGFRGKDGPIRLDYSGVANVPGAIQSIAELTAQPGDHFEVETVDSTGRVATVKAVAKPGGNSGQNAALTADERSTLIAIVNAIGTFNVPNGQELMDAFNAAWGGSGDDSGSGDSGGSEETTTPFGVEWTEGYLVSVSGNSIGTLIENSTWVASDYIDVTGKSEVRIHNDTGKLATFQGCCYDESKTAKNEEAWYYWKHYVQGSTAYPSPLVLAIPDGAKYVRLSTGIRYGSESAGFVRYDELTYELA